MHDSTCMTVTTERNLLLDFIGIVCHLPLDWFKGQPYSLDLAVGNIWDYMFPMLYKIYTYFPLTSVLKLLDKLLYLKVTDKILLKCP